MARKYGKDVDTSGDNDATDANIGIPINFSTNLVMQQSMLKLPATRSYHRQFVDGAFYSSHAGYKKSLYAYLYGSFSESLTWNDFFNCYLWAENCNV